MVELASILAGYLTGSIPTAYLVGRWKTGGDIRRMGGGNVGALNTFREIGPGAGVFVMVVDIVKGAGSVALAYWIFGVSPTWVMLAGLTSVVGHNWMVWLKFKGGKGMGSAIGALAVLFPIYGYPWLLLLLAAIVILPLALTRNVALSMGIGLVCLPLTVWLGTGNTTAVLIATTLFLIIGLKFLPTAVSAQKRSKGIREFIFDNWRRKRTGEREDQA
ncbi:MAG: glycerol-3-phosphate acyltransferase [Dehalococcoidaceae bacterium]|nr:glycerol-3-phosphate acyltransferase [Dehalococcoidaceae bacterium]